MHYLLSKVNNLNNLSNVEYNSYRKKQHGRCAEITKNAGIGKQSAPKGIKSNGHGRIDR
jgi:hypothetical protein